MRGKLLPMVLLLAASASLAEPKTIAVVPKAPPPVPAPFAGLCRALMRRKGEVTAEFYLGGVKHMCGKYEATCTNGLAAALIDILDGNPQRDHMDLDAWNEACRALGDVDAIALGILLGTLTDEQRAVL